MMKICFDKMTGVVFLFLIFLSGVVGKCHLPSKFWCDSAYTANICKVEKQCRQRQDDRVHFALYYETLCPDCKDFMRNQLGPAYQAVGAILDLTLVPYGNAMESQQGDTWVFTCQHGADECQGNLIQTCAIHVAANVSVYFPFIHCMETSDLKPLESALQCSKNVPNLDFGAVMSCVNSSDGNKLEHEMALKTNKLDPPHTFVPWVTLNEVHTDDIQREAEENLVKLICDTYPGSRKPDACQKKPMQRACPRN